jgi:adenylate cyclase
MRNIELKLIVKDFKEIVSLLKKIGAKYDRTLNQIDAYYNCKNGRLKIRSINNKNFELIFYQRPDKKGTKISNYQVLKIEPSQIDAIKSIFDNAFNIITVVKKQRILWIYKHTRIHLDSVGRLGKFLEIETVVDNINLRQAKKEYDEVVRFLNLSKYKKYKKSYSDLLISTKRH